MTTPSGEPYQYGDDTVAARLEVDISPEAISSLSEVNRLTADLRANMEATAKYSRDYSDYLRELPGALGEVDSAQSRLSESRASIFGGGDMSPIPDPFAGRDYGTSSTDMSGRAGSGRPMRGVDEDTLINLARNNPRQVANMAADRGLDEYFEDGSHILPRSEPGPRPGAGREMQFAGGSGPPSTPRSPRSSTGPGDDDGRAAGTTTGRQVGPEGTESQAERAANRLIEELDRRADNRDFGQRARGFGENIGNSPLLNTLNNEFSSQGRNDLLGAFGGVGRNIQSSAEGFTARAEQVEEDRQSLLARAGEVAATNPELAAQLTERAKGLGAKAAGMGRIAPLAKGAGIAGAAVAGAAGVNLAVQKTGETIQDFRGTGVQMGGGVAEGAAFEAQIRTMAMNPFISMEQSRKIMQSALQSGYTGKEMDTMTEFMTDNLKQMNMEAAESMKLLQQNVLKGGQDIQGVQAQLSQNVAMAGETNLSADQINDLYQRLSGQLIDKGVGGQYAGEIAQISSTLFEDNPILKDSGPNILSSIASNPSHQAYFADRSGARDAGILSANSQVWAAENLSSEEYAQSQIEAMGDVLQTYVRQYASEDENERLSAVRRAGQRLRGMGVQVTDNEAGALLEEYVSGDLLNRPAEAQAEWEERGGGQVNERQGGGMSALTGSLDPLKDMGASVRVGWNHLFGDEGQVQNARDAKDRRTAQSKLSHQLDTAGYTSSTGKTYTPEILEQLALEEYGGDIKGVTVVDEDGTERQITNADLTNEEFANKLRGGEIKVKTEEHGEQTLREWGNTVNTNEAGGSTTHEIGMNEETRRFFNLTSTPNPAQQRANKGSGSHNSDEAGMYGYGPQGGN